jgi:O-antigen/teichoic acid export membrane protein
MLLAPIQTAFDLYWHAQLFHIIKRADARAVFARVFTYWMGVLSFCLLGLLVATPPMLRLMMPPEYTRAGALVPIVLVAYFFRALGDFFRVLFVANGRPSYDATCNWITAGFSLAAYFLLIPRYGITGAAVATLLTFAVAGAIAFFWTRKIWPHHLDVVRVGKLAVVTGALTAAHFAIPSSSVIMDIVRGSALLLAFPVLLVLWRFPSSAEKELVRSAIARLRLTSG